MKTIDPFSEAEINSPDVTDGIAQSRIAACKAVPKNLCKNINGPTKIIKDNPAWPFRSSQTNYEIVKDEYQNSPVEKYVATAFGDEIPAMRNELIKRKHSGEGFLERHVHAWSKSMNWKVDPENDMKEEADPIQAESKTNKACDDK